jgi:hypothetical protein
MATIAVRVATVLMQIPKKAILRKLSASLYIFFSFST